MGKCIYCNGTDELSESDIIPDALTNAKLRNYNVCKIEHNNKFSNMFESKIIHSLSIITNELDIKSSKAKKYVSYKVALDVDGVEFSEDVHSDAKLFGDDITKSTDGKFLMGPLDKIQKIAKAKDGDTSKVEIVDINALDLELGKKLSLSVFQSKEMFRLISKIAYEWYCQLNMIDGLYPLFSDVVNYITTGNGENPVEIVSCKEVYKCISTMCSHGSHTLYSYIDENTDELFVIVSLFGVAIYRVKLCVMSENPFKLNCLYQELMVDGQKEIVVEESLITLCSTLQQSFRPVPTGEGLTCRIPIDMSDLSLKAKHTAQTIMLVTMQGKDAEDETAQVVTKILFERYNEILNTSLLHRKSLKRFVRDFLGDFNKSIEINPKATNRKQIFMTYIVFIIGHNSIAELSNRILNDIVAQKLGNSAAGYVINEELCERLLEEILECPNYSDILERGGKIIMNWE